MNSYRYERKFFISEISSHDINYIIKQNPGMFSETYYKRCINNIYLDTLGLDNYFDNIHGDLRRTKTRIRWYGELFGHIAYPILEFKIKVGLVGRKLRYKLPSFKLDACFNMQKFYEYINHFIILPE